MAARYELAQVANAVLLELVSAEHGVSLLTLAERLAERIVEIRRSHPSFDFAYWSRGTLSEVVEYLSGVGLIELHGSTVADLRTLDHWSQVFVRHTKDSEPYILRARSVLAQVFHEIEHADSAVVASA
jgi:hypothetical protein